MPSAYNSVSGSSVAAQSEVRPELRDQRLADGPLLDPQLNRLAVRGDLRREAERIAKTSPHGVRSARLSVRHEDPCGVHVAAA